MKKPLSLIIINIILVVTGILRIFVGLIGISTIENMNTFLIMSFYLDNILFGILTILSGVLMLLGKKAGAFIYTVSVSLLIIYYLVFSGLLETLTYTILPLILLIILIIIIKTTKSFKKTSF